MPPPLRPKLRPLEVIPYSHEGEEYLLLRDRLGIAPDAQVPRAIAPILGLLDGTRAVPDVIAGYRALGGEKLDKRFVENLIAQADEGLLLESPFFERERRGVMREFASSPTRPAIHAGMSYPAEAPALRSKLDSFFVRAALYETPRREYSPAQLRGVVVPHIDFTRGGSVEALSYLQLRPAHFDTIIVLGIAHSGVHYPFCGAAKDYATPLGTARCDLQFMQDLEARLGDKLTLEQFAHKSEHSIEFVSVFLQAVESMKNARIVPILCGGFHRETRGGTSPAQNADVAEFCVALRELVQEREARGEKIGLIASVDLAHIGTQFGDETPLTRARLQEIEREDRAFLSCAQRGDAEALHAHIARDDNARNIDAHPALYTLLHAFPQLRAQLLRYDQAFDAEANSLVSFASMALYEE